MSIPAGMLSERVRIERREEGEELRRWAHVLPLAQRVDLPELRDWSITVTVRYDSGTRETDVKDYLHYDGWRYTILEINIRRAEGLMDIKAGARRRDEAQE